MKGYFIDETSYNILVKLATVQVALTGDTNFLDVLEVAKPVDI